MSQLYNDPIFGDFFNALQHYKKFILSGLIATLLMVFGYSYYLDSMQYNNTMAMDYYLQYKDAEESDDRSTTDQTLEILKAQYPSYLHSSIAALSQAAFHMKQQNFEIAKTELAWVFHHSPDPFFIDLAHYKFAEIAKYEGQTEPLKYHIHLIQNPEIKILGDHIVANAYVEEGLFDEALNHYEALLAQCQDPAYKALLTNEYHIVNLLIS